MEGENNCEDTCINTHGSYRCSCPESFEVAEDGYSCLGKLVRMDSIIVLSQLGLNSEDLSSCQRVCACEATGINMRFSYR